MFFENMMRYQCRFKLAAGQRYQWSVITISQQPTSYYCRSQLTTHTTDKGYRDE